MVLLLCASYPDHCADGQLTINPRSFRRQNNARDVGELLESVATESLKHLLIAHALETWPDVNIPIAAPIVAGMGIGMGIDFGFGVGLKISLGMGMA